MTRAQLTIADFLERALNLIIAPRAEWDRIAAERQSVSGLLLGYVAPLAAANGAALFIGNLLGQRYDIGLSAVSAAGLFLVILLGAYLCGRAIEWMAATFGGEQNLAASMQLAGYAATPALIAGLFQILPPIGWLSVLGLYGLYVLYLGIVPMKKAPDGRRATYFFAILGVSLVVFLALSALYGGVLTALRPYSD